MESSRIICMKKPFGMELLLDLYNCDPKVVDDLSTVYDFLDGAVKVMGVSKQAPPFVFHSPSNFPDKAGISAWVPLIESGIQCHTLTVKNFISIDYYTCSNVDETMKDRLIEYAKMFFSPTVIESKFVLRGEHYYD